MLNHAERLDHWLVDHAVDFQTLVSLIRAPLGEAFWRLAVVANAATVARARTKLMLLSSL